MRNIFRTKLRTVTSFYTEAGRPVPQSFNRELTVVKKVLKGEIKQIQTDHAADVLQGREVQNWELELAACILCLAVINPHMISVLFFLLCCLFDSIEGSTGWDVKFWNERVRNFSATLGSDANDKTLDKLFDCASFGSITDPCIVTDSWGKILLWYLPGIITPSRQVRL